MSVAIEFNNISKLYRLGLVSTGTLAHDMKRWWTINVRGKEDPYLTIGETNDRSVKGESDYVWALKDINFKVEQGDVVGIIGKNGAGKSTLLKLLSKVTAPTTGEIRAKGRIGALLEVGTGFHSEMTGRENIYLNGAILGMTKPEIAKKLDEIIDFSGCERYIDTPVKRYSSGMMVRLGFAVAAHLDPEILVVDEVLAVGDAEFQKKAIGKMQDVSRGEGRTVLFVSHNMGAVRSLCKNGCVLKNGKIDYIGTSEDCINHYLEDGSISEMISYAKIEKKHRPWDDQLQELEILSARLLNNPDSIATDDDLNIELEIKVNKRVYDTCQYSVNIDDDIDQRILNFISNPIAIPTDKEIYKVAIIVKHHDLTKRKYWISFSIGEKDFSKGIRNYDSLHHVLSFEVKYINRKKELEYTTWSKNWGPIIHTDGFIDVTVQ